MAKLGLKIQTPGATMLVKVDASICIGDFIAVFVKRIGYHQTDLTGIALLYELRYSTGGPVFPPEASFAQLEVVHGSILRLDIAGGRSHTLPISPLASFSSVTTHRDSEAKGWTRRSVLQTGICAVMAVSGLTLGVTTAHMQHTQAARSVKPSATQPNNATETFPTTIQQELVFTQHQQPVHAVGWSSDGRFLASASEDATVLVWQMDGTVRQQLPHPAPVQVVAWAPDGQRIVTGAANEVFFWEALTGNQLAQQADQHTEQVTSLAWSAHAPAFVISGSKDKRAIVWSTMNAGYQVQTIFTQHTATIEAVSWASDGQTVATSSHGGLTRVWQAMDGQEVHGYYQPVNVPTRTLQFSPVAPQLAIGADDSMIYLWNNGLACQQENGQFGARCTTIPQQLRVHTKPVRVVAWSPAGKLLASGGEDGTLAIWSPATSQLPLLTVQLPDSIASLAWNDTGQYIAVASGNSIGLWHLR